MTTGKHFEIRRGTHPTTGKKGHELWQFIQNIGRPPYWRFVLFGTKKAVEARKKKLESQP